MISLHRLGHRQQPFLVNPDLIFTIEACPDTVVTLTTGARFVVVERPAEVADEIRAWRAGILFDALHRPEAFVRAADHPIEAL
jgi:flagellar protein FlbD